MAAKATTSPMARKTDIAKFWALKVRSADWYYPDVGRERQRTVVDGKTSTEVGDVTLVSNGDIGDFNAGKAVNSLRKEEG